MGISHFKTDPQADFTGTVTIFDASGISATVNATEMVRPSDWNSAHQVIFNLSGNTAGSSQITGSDVILMGGANITLSADTANSKLQIIGGAGVGGGIAAAAGTQTGTSGTIVFANSNGATFGMSGSTQITMDFGSSSLAGTGFTSTTTAGTQVKATLSTNGLSMAVPAFLTTTAAQTNQQMTMFATSNTTQSSSGTNNASSLIFAGAGIASVGITNGSIVISATQTVQTQASGNIARTGITTGATAGSQLAATHDTAGISLGVPAWITTYVAQTNQSAIKGLGVSNTGATAGNTGISSGVDWVLAGSQSLTLSQSTAVGGPNTIWIQHPAWLTTQSVQTQASGNIAGTGTTFNGANISGSMTMNTAGLQLSMSVAAPGGGGTLTMYAQSNTTQSSSGTANVSSLNFAGAGIASVGISNGSVVISVPVGGGAGDGYNIVSMLTSTSGGGTAGATFSALSASVGFMAGSNITLSQTSNTIVVNAPASSSLDGSSGISISTNGSTISVYNAPMRSLVLPSMNMSVLGAMGNGSFSIAYRDIDFAVSATRVDMPFFWQQGSSATTNTVALAMTVMCGIYTRNASTLNSVSTATTQTTYTYASNSAGVTALTVARHLPISIPMNVNMTPGAYYVGFGISTSYSSIGLSTTTAAQTISAIGIPTISSAVPWVGDLTQVSATSIGMISGHGIYSAAIATAPTAISLSAINQSGSYFHRANIALIFRN